MDAVNQQQTATFTIPVVVPPELQDLVKELSELKTELKDQIEYYRAKNKREIYSEAEAAEYFGISVKSMRQIRNDGLINYTPVKGQFFYTEADFYEYVAREKAGLKKKK